MTPIATDVARSLVSLSVCLCVSHMGMLCKYGWTDRDAIWGGWRKKFCSGGWLLWAQRTIHKWGSRSHSGKSKFGGRLAHWKALGVFTAVSAATGIIQYSIVTAAADCNAPDSSLSYYIVPHEKSALWCALLPKFFDDLLLLLLLFLMSSLEIVINITRRCWSTL